MAFETSAPAEVVRLHRFFDDWYNGLPGLTIAQFEDAMDPRFTIVTPDGDILSQPSIVAAVGNGFGKGGITITVEDFHVEDLGTVVVCRYDEIHETPQEVTRRISTAVMVIDLDTPGGYRWISVHETWAVR
jgi:hypothetical protein